MKHPPPHITEHHERAQWYAEHATRQARLSYLFSGIAFGACLITTVARVLEATC